MMKRLKRTVAETDKEFLEDQEIEKPMWENGDKKRLSSKDIFNAIYHEMYYEIYFFIRKMIVNQECIEDILQETFFEVYKNIDKIKSHENYRGWVYITAKNKSKKANQQWRVKLENEDKSINFIENIEYDKQIDENLVLLDYQKQITKEEYDLLEKHFIQGYTILEIAKEKDIQEGACKMRISRALKKLRKSTNGS